MPIFSKFMHISTNIKGALWALSSSFSFAIMNVIIKDANIKFTFNAAELVFWRNFPAMFILGFIAIRNRQVFITPRIKGHLYRSTSGALAMVFLFYSLSKLPLTTSATIANTSALSLALLSFILLGERIKKNALLALFLGMSGVVILLKPDFTALDKGGLLAAGINTLLAGFAYLQLRQLTQTGEPSWRIVFYFCLISSILSGILAMIQGWNPITLTAIPYLVILCLSALSGQMCLTRAYAIGEKFTVASFMYATVVFSALWAHFYFNEPLELSQIVAMAIIISAGILSALPMKKGEKS